MPLFVLLTLGLILSPIFRSRERWWKEGGVWALLVLLLFLTASYLPGVVAGLRGFYFLHTLAPQEVESITVDRQTITDRSVITAISAALHDVRWFSNNHDGWASPVSLRVRLRRGEEKAFMVALYLRQPGAVIRGRIGRPGFYTTYDCGFSAELPDVLTRLNAPLPAAPTTPTGPGVK